MRIASPDEVLDFWFGDPPPDRDALMSCVARWFQGGPALDRVIVARFGPAVDAAVEGRLDAWIWEPRSRLALVLLLDQLTRSVFRDTATMYAGDAFAQALALRSLVDGVARELSYVEQLFLALPLLHAEDAWLQRRGVQVAEALATIVPPLHATMSAMHLEQSRKYCAVIERFGRFPHRNAILGRRSTPEELAFLVDWPAKQRPQSEPSPVQASS